MGEGCWEMDYCSSLLVTACGSYIQCEFTVLRLPPTVTQLQSATL